MQSPSPPSHWALATVIITLELLFAILGSGWLPATVAVLVTEPAIDGVTLIVTKASLPLFSVPRLQVTVPAALLQVPWVVKTWLTPRPVGRSSLTTTPVAVLGPAFLTLRT